MIRNLQNPFLASLVSLSIIVSQSTPIASGAISVSVNGNGSETENQASIHYSQTQTVAQQNVTNIDNSLTTKANTGQNTVSENTGSDVSVQTGSVSSVTHVTNTTGMNTADLSCETCTHTDLTIDVSKNGSESYDSVSVASQQSSALTQSNTGTISNAVYQDLNTGKNTANKNVGYVVMQTGSINHAVAVANTYGINTAKTTTPGLAGTIAVYQNGSGSQSIIQVGVYDEKLLDQQNSFSVFNDISVYKNTGNNNCIKNVGGCEILTGNITSEALIENTGGFNVIDDNCCDKPEGPEHPGGGPIDTEKPKDKDNGKKPDGGIDGKEEEPSIIEKIVQKIVPTVLAAEDDEVPNGMGMLPITGWGNYPSVSWAEALLGLYLLICGAYLRQVAYRLYRRFEK